MKSYKEVYKMVKRAYDFTQMTGNDATYDIMNQRAQYEDQKARKGNKVEKDSKPAPPPPPKAVPTRKTPTRIFSSRGIFDYLTDPEYRQRKLSDQLQKADPTHPMYNSLAGTDLDLRTKMSTDAARNVQWIKNPETIPMVYQWYPNSLTAADRLKVLNNVIRRATINRRSLYQY